MSNVAQEPYILWLNYGAKYNNGKCGVAAVVSRGDKKAVLAGTITPAADKEKPAEVDKHDAAWRALRWAFDKLADKKLPIIVRYRNHEAQEFIAHSMLVDPSHKWGGEKVEFSKYLSAHREFSHEFAEGKEDFTHYMRARIHANEVKLG